MQTNLAISRFHTHNHTDILVCIVFTQIVYSFKNKIVCHTRIPNAHSGFYIRSSVMFTRSRSVHLDMCETDWRKTPPSPLFVSDTKSPLFPSLSCRPVHLKPLNGLGVYKLQIDVNDFNQTSLILANTEYI